MKAPVFRKEPNRECGAGLCSKSAAVPATV